MSVAATMTNGSWYFSGHDDLWMISQAKSQSEVIEEGRDYHSDGEPFQVAYGAPRGAWPTLFSDWDDLAEYIDSGHEDNAFEEPFTTEAGLGKAELQPLCDELNAVWVRFVERVKPTSSLLNLGPSIDVPATAEWLAAHPKDSTQ